MKNDGKHLEGLIALVEKLHLPSGFEVKTNERVFDDSGNQIAEFDIRIQGKIGTAQFSWLIECRDRPSDGPAPGAWIEQLVGRKERFQFSRVTAVSTTGFAHGAIRFAEQKGIETRKVTALAPECFADWLSFDKLQWLQRWVRLDDARLLIDPNESEDRQQALRVKLEEIGPNRPLLRAIDSGSEVSVYDAFNMALDSQPQLLADAGSNKSTKPVNLRARFPDDSSHFVVETSCGLVRIREIVFRGELSAIRSEIPLGQATEYAHVPTGKAISQTAAFPFDAFGMSLSLDVHKLVEPGEVHVVLRNVGPRT